MIQKFAVSVFLLFVSLSLYSQNKLRLGDFGFFSIHRPFPAPAKKTIVPVFQFDGQNMFVGKRSVRLGGIKIGAMHVPTGIKAGLGFYAFTNRLLSHDVFVANAGGLTTVETDFGLMNLFVEPRVFQSDRFYVSVPVTLGYGSIDQYYVTLLGSLRPHREMRLTTFSAIANAEVHLFYWLSVGGGLGYHHFGTADKVIQRDYSGFVYNIKLKIDIIDIYKTIVYKLEK